MPNLRVFELLTLASFFALTGACGPTAVQRTAPTAEDRFARAFLATLRDSGVAVASTRLKASTAARAESATMLTQLRQILQSSSRADSLPLAKWEVERATDRPAATHLIYSVPGFPGQYQIGVWVEAVNGTLVAETIHYGPAQP